MEHHISPCQFCRWKQDKHDLHLTFTETEIAFTFSMLVGMKTRRSISLVFKYGFLFAVNR